MNAAVKPERPNLRDRFQFSLKNLLLAVLFLCLALMLGRITAAQRAEAAILLAWLCWVSISACVGSLLGRPLAGAFFGYLSAPVLGLIFLLIILVIEMAYYR